MYTILLATGLIAAFFILMSVRLIFIKDGKFKGTCASQSPFLKSEGSTCGYCGRNVDEEGCGKNEKGEVEKVMERFN